MLGELQQIKLKTALLSTWRPRSSLLWRIGRAVKQVQSDHTKKGTIGVSIDCDDGVYASESVGKTSSNVRHGARRVRKVL